MYICNSNTAEVGKMKLMFVCVWKIILSKFYLRGAYKLTVLIVDCVVCTL